MLKLINLLLTSWVLLGWSAPLYASVTPAESQSEVKEGPETLPTQITKVFGITYFSYFYGPGLHPDNSDFNPNQLGFPENDGIYFQNQMSLRYKFSKNLALDFQSRFKTIVNNYTNNSDFSRFRWETPRIGVSGELVAGKGWSLIGSINSDFPYVLPAPFTGYQAQQRTVLFTPGMFAMLKYTPEKSKWSLFAVLHPRYLFYSDRNAAEPQFINAGFSARNKPEFILSLQPTLNYGLSEKIKLTMGTTIDYRKQVISSWNFLNASLASNGDSDAWRLYAVPINLGVTYTFGPALTIFPYISTYPIAIQRKDATTGKQASLLDTTSIGMWLSGTLF